MVKKILDVNVSYTCNLLSTHQNVQILLLVELHVYCLKMKCINRRSGNTCMYFYFFRWLEYIFIITLHIVSDMV